MLLIQPQFPDERRIYGSVLFVFQNRQRNITDSLYLTHSAACSLLMRCTKQSAILCSSRCSRRLQLVCLVAYTVFYMWVLLSIVGSGATSAHREATPREFRPRFPLSSHM